MEKNICKLCLEEKKLLKKSHIIPNFMYQELYDDKNRFETFNLNDIDNKRHYKTLFSGEYESGILCHKCDNEILGKYETYASKMLYGKNLTKAEAPIVEGFTSSDGIKYIISRNINYTNFKLFLLSILWRASISTRPIFDEVKLHNENIIREMLLNENPGNEYEIPINAISWLNDNSLRRDWIVKPLKGQDSNGTPCYFFPINGAVWIFYESFNPKTDIIYNCIKKDNSLEIVHLPKGSFGSFFKLYSGAKS